MEAQTRSSQTSDKGGGVKTEDISIPITKLDAVGGTGGDQSFDEPLGSTARIVQMKVRFGEVVDSIQMVVNAGGGDLTLEKNGGNGGALRPFSRLGSGEYIAKVEVSYGEVIDRLTFHVPGRPPISFGGSGGDHHFTLQGPVGTEVCGFHGRYGENLDSLGIYYRERKP